MRILQKRCLYCHALYRPDPRTASFQKSCSHPACRLKRKHESQAKFLNKNSGYFRGRYANSKSWLAEHPGYLARYRATHPEQRAKKRLQDRLRQRRIREAKSDIQVTILRRKAQVLQGLRGSDIQDTIRLRVDGLLSTLAGNTGSDIQVQSAFLALAP